MTKLEALTSDTIAGLKVAPVTEFQQRINLLVYGDPGVGKTRLAGSASRVSALSPVLLIDVEGGTRSLASDYPEVQVVRVKTWEEVTKLYEWLYDHQHNGDYQTVVVDSLSEMQKFSMERIMEKTVAKDSSRERDVPGMREWGINGEQIRRLVRGLRDLDLNVILTAHAMDDKDDRTGISKTKPSLSGKLKNEVAGFVDIVSFMYKKRVVEGTGQDKVRRNGTFLLSEATAEQVGKDRSGRLPTVLEDPTMEIIYNYINGGTQ